MLADPDLADNTKSTIVTISTGMPYASVGEFDARCVPKTVARATYTYELHSKSRRQ
jgi:hypothetical protein